MYPTVDNMDHQMEEY